MIKRMFTTFSTMVNVFQLSKYFPHETEYISNEW